MLSHDKSSKEVCGIWRTLAHCVKSLCESRGTSAGIITPNLDDVSQLRTSFLSNSSVLRTSERSKQSGTETSPNSNGQASVFSTMVNLFSTITGAGMLGLPYAFANSGVALGMTWFTIIGFGEIYTMHLFGKCLLREEKYSFQAMAQKTLKFRGSEHLVNVILSINCFGCCCGYLIICGQLLPDLILHFMDDPIPSYLLNGKIWITSITWVIVFPLVCLKSINALRFTSTLGFIGIVYVSVLTVIFGYGGELLGDPCKGHEDCPGNFCWGFPGNIPNQLRVISIFCWAFVATQNIPSLTLELKSRSLRRLDISIFGASMSVFAIYSVTALAGYNAFGDYVNANLLKSFPVNLFPSVARLCIAIVLSLCIPLQVFPLKNSVCNMLFGMDAVECSSSKYYGVIISLLLAAWAVVVGISDLSIVMAFIGGTSSMYIGYTFPAYFYIKVFAKDGLTFDRVVSYVILVMSLLLSPLLVAVEIYSLADG